MTSTLRLTITWSLLLAGTMTVPTRAADPFHLSIGSPVALMNNSTPNSGATTKSALLAVRGEACTDPAGIRVKAHAEGLVGGARQSSALVVTPATPTGAFAVSRPPAAGQWVVVLTGTCQAQTAAAVVPVTPSGFDREGSMFYPREPTTGEVEAVLKRAPIRPEAGRKP